MTIEPDKELSLVNQGYAALRSGIVRGTYPPGVRLKLDTLQQALGVSSSPLREALNRLVAEGLVEVEEGRGFRAAQISAKEFGELTHLRLLIEVDALDRAVELGDDEWEGRVVSASHKLRRVEDRLLESDRTDHSVDEEWSARHRLFHMALLSGCANPRQMQFCGTLFDQAERYRRICRQLSKQPRKKTQEHKAIEEAALGRDRALAVQLLTAHIQKTADRVAAILRKEVEINGAAAVTA
jgi:DNA-binding GntR family transcriptional regulator